MNDDIGAGIDNEVTEDTAAQDTSGQDATVDSELLDRLELIKSQPLQQQAESFEQLYQELRQDVE